MALDVLALMDALKIEKAVLVGLTWDRGRPTSSRRSGRDAARHGLHDGLPDHEPRKQPAGRPFQAWSGRSGPPYYFSTERGVKGLQTYRHERGELLWKFNSPTWNFSQATYNTTAAAFTNDDYVAIIIDNYRWRLDLVPGDPRFANIEKKLDAAPTIAVPTVTVDGKFDPFTPPGNGSAYRAHFTGKYAHHTLPVGHNVPQEDPRGFARAVVQADHL